MSPRCYELKGVEYDPAQPVVRATSADIYKAKHGNRFLCLKMVRLVDSEILWVSFLALITTQEIEFTILVDARRGAHTPRSPLTRKSITFLWSLLYRPNI